VEFSLSVDRVYRPLYNDDHDHDGDNDDHDHNDDDDDHDDDDDDDDCERDDRYGSTVNNDNFIR
jgi:hypothetical protein